MKTGIVGYGTVGKTTLNLLVPGDISVYDARPEVSQVSLQMLLERSDIVFVCIPETRLDEFFQFSGYDSESQEQFQVQNYVVRSTTPIGTVRRLAKDHHLNSVCHWPEFISDREVASTARNRIVIGTPGWPEECSYAARLVWSFCLSRFPGIVPQLMTSDESEAVKLMDNAFGAVKVSLFNEFYFLAKACGLDWNKVLAGLLSGGRIGEEYTRVPGPDGMFGWGGKCWPKDVQTLLDHVEDTADAEMTILNAAATRNIADREGA